MRINVHKCKDLCVNTCKPMCYMDSHRRRMHGYAHNSISVQRRYYKEMPTHPHTLYSTAYSPQQCPVLRQHIRVQGTLHGIIGCRPRNKLAN